jgi:hypothetical protein
MKCCGSSPRCRACPVRWSTELARLEGKAVAPAPAHLAGVPSCLHKYEPLFRRAAGGSEAAAAEREAPAAQQLPVAG